MENKNYLDMVKSARRQPTRVSDDFQMPTIPITESPPGRRYSCTCCGKTVTKQEGNFYKAGNSVLWQANNGYMPICKTCAETFYKGLSEFYSGNDEKALELFCNYFDMFYDELASSMAETGLEGRAKVCTYPSKLATRQVKARGATFLDTIKAKCGEVNPDSVGDGESYIVGSNENIEEEFVVTPKMKKKWGIRSVLSDYQWLEEKEAEWKTDTEITQKSQEELIRMICIADLRVLRAEQEGGKVEDAMKAYQSLLDTCNLQPKQKASAALLSGSKAPGEMIMEWENSKPVPESNPKIDDIDGLRQTYAECLGHTCESVHLPIPKELEADYKKLMDKYTIVPQRYNSDGDEDISILDKYAVKGDKDGE